MSNYHGYKEEAINLIRHYLPDIIKKTVKPSHSEKLQIVQNKNKLFRFVTARIKIHQISHIILGPRVSFFSNFASFFSVMRHNSSLLFHLNIYMLWTKGAH